MLLSTTTSFLLISSNLIR
jgi:hypothetical protein